MSTDVGFRSERGPVLISLMVTTGLVAIDATVLATAIPTVVADLGDFALFPWLFSLYLLTQAVTTPIYAKLADTFGRKPIILVGISLFLLGSILCGLAWSMPALIVFRAIQGLGAGAVQPMSITIVGDIYTIAERARIQGYLASVWGAASVIGPTLGGLFAQFGIWRLVFFINVPLCVLAGFMLIRSFHESIETREHKIDFLGAVLLTASMSLLILAVLEGGRAWPWNSPQIIGAFTVGGLLLVAFVFAERRALEPILPLWVFSRRLLRSTTLVGLGIGAVLIGLTSYVPTYLQGSIGAPPLVAGLALAALTIGWPITAAFSGRLYLRIGFKNTGLIGITFVILGALVLAAFSATPMIAVVAAACFTMGAGMGLVAAPTLIAAQSSVQWNERGVVTGTNLFARSIGSAVGVAIFGAVANSIFGAVDADGLDPAAVEAGSGAVFAGVAIVAVAAAIAVLTMPRTPVAPVVPPDAALA